MAKRVIKTWGYRLVEFGNLEIRPQSWKTQWLQLFELKDIALDLWKNDRKCRNPEYAVELQKKIRMYLSLITEPDVRGKPRIAPRNLDDVVVDLEDFSERIGINYSIRILREEDDLFEYYKKVKIVQWGENKIKVIKTPDFKSLEQYLYTCLAESLESGEIWKMNRCQYHKCRKFLLAERKGMKMFCNKLCRWDFNNKKPGRNEYIRRTRKQNKKNAQIREKRSANFS